MTITAPPEKLQWNEPLTKLRHDWLAGRKNDKWGSLKMAGITFVFMLALRGFVEMNADNNPNRPGWPASFAMAVGVALFVGFIFPWYFYLLPGSSLVVISPTGVGTNFFTGKSVAIRRYGWEEIGSCSVYPVRVGPRDYTMFAVHDAEGEPMDWWALGGKMTASDLDDWFRRHGKQLYRKGV